jgi:hypothetical protein
MHRALTLCAAHPYDPRAPVVVWHDRGAPSDRMFAKERRMPDIDVEEAVKQNCQAVLVGDLMRIMGDLTPEALGKLMASGGGGGMGAMPTLTAFDIQSHDTEGEDHIFKVKFTGDQDFTAVATWRDVGGTWKIADLAMEHQ